VSASTRTLLADWNAVQARREAALQSASPTATVPLPTMSPAARQAPLVPDLVPSFPPSIDCQMNSLYLFERYINNSYDTRIFLSSPFFVAY
jgi:hypothetical protein